MDEEVVLLEEQLAAAHAEIEQLQSRLSRAEADAAGRESETSDLRRRLATSQEMVAQHEASLAAQASQTDELRASLKRRQPA